MEDLESRRKKRGDLFIVGTPIGNLEDLTFRALRILREVSAIACEDTRRTLKLLTRYGVQKRLISYFQPKEGQRIPQILALLDEGKDIALVSDAGTPGVSDPGYRLIRQAIEAGLKVIPVPGPSAAIAALSASGLPTHRFLFLGFPPPKSEKTRQLLLSLREEEATLLFYLPTRKTAAFLTLALEIFGDREAVFARELTKVHEELLRGPLSRILEEAVERTFKGEATVLIRGRRRGEPEAS
jgi:16S rRNA (cytidine1402-2'-O)-methyltransferase